MLSIRSRVLGLGLEILVLIASLTSPVDRPHLSSNNAEHLDVSSHDNQRRYDEADDEKSVYKKRMLAFHARHHRVPVEMRASHTHVRDSADHQVHCPDGTDYCSQDAVGEGGKMGEWTNNDRALDDGHGSQVPERT